jgi:outer membrane lipoprotein SlyB
MVIREMQEGGTVSSPKLVLDLQNVEVNGQRYLVSTEDLSQSSDAGIGKNRRTAEMVGGGAALGGIIGAIAGGGKGAAIGAAVGAAAGGTAQVLTKGDRVRVPAETVLKFQLDQPMRLEAVR